jgi:hypothetical protein
MAATQHDRPQLHEASAAELPSGDLNPGLQGRFVALLTPVFAVAAAWVAGAVAQVVPGAHLDQNQLVVFMVTAATAVLAAGLKWLHGWQQHERLVAEGKHQPRGKPRRR